MTPKEFFVDSTGGRAFGREASYNHLEMIQEFIHDVYGVKDFFLDSDVDSRFANLPPILKRIHSIVNKSYEKDHSILDRRPQTKVFSFIDTIKPFGREEWIECILPLANTVFAWNEVKKRDEMTRPFLDHVQRRMKQSLKGEAEAEFYGALFEVEMAARYLNNNWAPQEHPETSSLHMNSKKIEWVFEKRGTRLGFECTVLLPTTEPTYMTLRDRMGEKATKFESQSRELDLDLGVLFIGVERSDYAAPKIIDCDVATMEWCDLVLACLPTDFKKPDSIGRIVLTWRERRVSDRGDDFIVRYAASRAGDNWLGLPRTNWLLTLSSDHFYIIQYPLPEIVGIGSEETCGY